MPSEFRQYGPWPRGVNYSRPADELGFDELYAMENTRLGNVGQADKRLGSAPLNGTALNASATVTAAGKMRFSAASSQTFAVAGNKFYSGIGGTPTDRTGTATITAGDDNTWDFVNANGTLVGHNGVSGDTILKWTGAAVNVATLDVDVRFTWAKFVEFADRRVWWANLSSGVNRVWYSDTDDPETYGANNFFSFDEDITGIQRWLNTVVVHTRNTLTMIVPTGDASTPYRKNPILLEDDEMGGTETGRAIVNVPGIGQVFIRRDGIWAITSAQEVVKISDKLDGARYWDVLNEDRLAYAFAQKYPAKFQVHFWLPSGPSQTKMNHLMILDYRLSKIMGEYVWYGPDVDMTRDCGALIDGLPHYGGFDGFLYKHETGNVDDIGASNTAIDAFFETGQPPPYGGAIDCRWQRARTFFEVKGTWPIEQQEQSPDIPSRTVNIEMGGSFDAIGTTFTIGVSAIAGDSEISYADNDLSGSSPFKKFRFRNANLNEPFSIRKILPIFEPLGPVPRDISGAH